MRHPVRWRAAGLTVAATAAIALACAFVVPRSVLDSWIGAVCILYGLVGLIFGSLLTSWWHREARAEAALRRGEGLVARWLIDPDTWRRFAELSRTLSINQQPVGKAERHAPVEALVGTHAIVIDAHVHTLAQFGLDGASVSRWGGDWSIEKAQIGGSDPCCIYLYVSMQGQHGARTFSNLVFPVPAAAEHEGRTAFESLRQRAESLAQLLAAHGG